MSTETGDADSFAETLTELPDLEEGDRVNVQLRETAFQKNHRKLTVEETGFDVGAPVKTGVLSGAKHLGDDGETVQGYVLSGHGTQYYLFVNDHLGERDDELRLCWQSKPYGRCVTGIEEVAD